MTDSPDSCVSCGCQIDLENGRSLDDSAHAHVCDDCWSNIEVADRIDLVAHWRAAGGLARAGHALADALDRSGPPLGGWFGGPN